ncbi:MAG: DUF255 domain-containing protein [Armatimonadota bacterium]|nr:DUF255 domain-containing protein [Armatimonadota bacterium]
MKQPSSTIRWMDWTNEAFAKAERENKLILLNISANWCHWCHVMDRTTYADPIVTRIITERFIPIRVDGDKRPDIQDRYLLGGWPTTAILTPNGRILNGSTYLPPDAMIRMLCETNIAYYEHTAATTMRIAQHEEEIERASELMEAPIPNLDEALLNRLSMALKREFDPWHGGFGSEPKFPYPDAIRFAFLRYKKTGDEDMLKIALKTLEGMKGIFDPVWGGFYRYSEDGSWTKPHYEKMLYVQAGALDNYVEAYQVTGEKRHIEIAIGIKNYLTRFLSDQQRGGFYGSQDADVGSKDMSRDLIPGEEYYPLDEKSRLEIGIPDVDTTIFTDWNGMIISAYCRLFQALGDEEARVFAVKTADRILAENMFDGKMYHYNDGEPRLPGLLSDQVYFAQGLVDLFQSTGQRKYLNQAEALAKFIISELQDKDDGGFYFQLYDPNALGQLKERHKPFDENVVAAKLLVELSYLTGFETYRDIAEKTFKTIAHPQIVESVLGAGFGVALDLYLNFPVHIVLVGKRESKETQEMLETSLHTYDPRKLVQLLDPSEDFLTICPITYKAEEKPLAYVCYQNECSLPLMSNEELASILENVLSAQS